MSVMIDNKKNAEVDHWAKVYAGRLAEEGFRLWRTEDGPADILADIRQFSRALAKEMCKEGEG